MKFATKRI